MKNTKGILALLTLMALAGCTQTAEQLQDQQCREKCQEKGLNMDVQESHANHACICEISPDNK